MIAARLRDYMPVYEYVCRDCQHEFEELTLSMTGDKAPPCPKCSSERATRKMSVFAARQGTPALSEMGGGCGRCGDPNGPCSM
jgi:putative FmdB family regulatory protein